MTKKQKPSEGKKEFIQFLVDIYRDNENFLDKAIFSFSSIAVAFIINLIVNVTEKELIDLLILPLIGFIIVIILHIFTLKFASIAYKKHLFGITDDDDDRKKEGEGKEYLKFEKWAENLAGFRDFIFIASLISIVIAIYKFSYSL